MKQRCLKIFSVLCLVAVCFLKTAIAQDARLLVLSEIEERIAGEMAIVSFEHTMLQQGYQIVSDPAITQMGRALARFSDRPHLHYSFYVIEGDLPPKAFSLPGGYVCLSRSLIQLVCQTDADIAFILGHEIAHSALRHYADYKLQDDQQVAYVRQLLDRNNLFKDQSSPGLVEEVQDILFPYMGKIRQMKEIEADQFGALYALRAGYQLSGGQQVLSRLLQQYGEGFQLELHEPEALSDSVPDASLHPTLSERIEQLELFRRKAVEVAKLFPSAREALDRGDYREASLLFETILSLFPQSRTAQIGLGVAFHLQYWDSVPGDDFLLAYPGMLELEYMYLLERGPRDLDALRQAIEDYRAVLVREPGNAYAMNNLGVALAEFNQFDEAETYLREALRLSDRDFTLFNLALLLRQQYERTPQEEIKQEAIMLMRRYLEFMPYDQVAVGYLQELESSNP